MNKKTRICLNAMVGNEAKTITRMLESVAPYIDYYVIQCNGADDNTREIINQFFKDKDIPGLTYFAQWEYPGWNRNHTLQKALKTSHDCDWILRMDADEKLHVDEDFNWDILNDTSIQSFNIGAEAGDTKYFRTWLWNAKLPWFFQNDKRHETIHLPEIGEGFQRIGMPWGFRHKVSQDGETWHVPRKFLNDALELEKDKVVGNKVLEDYYHLWYIAKSYADCYGNPNELPFGKIHSDEYARRSIWYYERFLELTHNWANSKTAKHQDEMSYFALCTMGHAHSFIGNNKEAEEHYLLAEQFQPQRNEHLLYLCEHLERQGKVEEMTSYLDKMLQPERVNPFPSLAFLIEDRAYYNTSNHLIEWKNRIEKKTKDFSINLDSIKFDFK
jgi:glycosyltransferase involved in cell wall biosynthesis